MRTRTPIANQHRQSGSRSALARGIRVRSVRPKGSPPKIEDAREHRRYAVAETTIGVTWLNTNGDVKTENGAQPMNVSERGMAVQLPEAALLLSRVRLEAGNGELLGYGKVRHCRPAGANYIVGIEFTDALSWRAPEDPINEPIPLCAPDGEAELIPGDESGGSSSRAATFPDELLWNETRDGGRPATRIDETRSLGKAEPGIASSGSEGEFAPALPEPHLLLDSRADHGFFARVPMAMKAGAAILMAVAMGFFLLGTVA